MIKIFSCIFLLMLCSTSVYAQSCLDIPFLQLIGPDSPEYLPQGIALCIHQKQCKQARSLMEKIKTKDQVKYSYLFGSALANGDCYKRNIKEAEKLLNFAAQYSEAGKRNLLRFYLHFSADYKKNKQFAFSLAEKGFLTASTFLADAYLQEQTPESYAMAYFWAKVALLQAQIHYEILRKQNEELPDIMKFDISADAQFVENLSALIMPLRAKFPEYIIRKIDSIAERFLSSLPKNRSKEVDPLSSIESIYGVLGAPIAPGQEETQKLKKIFPTVNIQSEHIEKYEKEVRSLLM